MEVTQYTRLLMRRRSTSEWESLNEVLMDGEIGVVQDVVPRKFKIGDGVTAWNDLEFSGSSSIEDWISDEPSSVGDLKIHNINGVNYLFQSLIDENTDEPTLSTSNWQDSGKYFSGAWNSAFTYSWIGAIISSGGIAYKSLQVDNENHAPASSPLWWQVIGAFRGDFNPATTYALNDVVTDPANVDGYGNKRVYISQSADNVSSLTGGSWKLIGPSKDINTFPTYTSLHAANPRPDGVYRVLVDDSEGTEDGESFYLSFKNRLFYQVVLEM